MGNLIPITRPWLPPLAEYVGLLEEVWSSGMLSNFGPMAARLEAIARAQLENEAVFSVASGDIGLMVALAALQIEPGAPCFLPSFTFNSTINAALWNRFRPVFVDIEPGALTMDPEDLARAMAEHPTPGVVLATHVFGNPCDADTLRARCEEHGSRLVFDAAHAYGSRRDGVPAGRLGDLEVFSLSGTKLVTSAEGGLISTTCDELVDRIRHLRAYGFQWDYNSKYVGLNGKLSELHAALGVLTLSHVEDAIARRLEIVERYRAALGTAVTFQAVDERDVSTFKDVFVDLGEHRDEVESALRSADVQTKRYFLPLHLQDAYGRYAGPPLPVTARTYASGLCVPAYSDLDTADIDRICETILATLA